MGITKLTDLIREQAGDAITNKTINEYEGKVVALDASVVMNQFRTAKPNQRYLVRLSQIIGMFYRTACLLEKGIKPLYVFDGPPPKLKDHVLVKRAELARLAQAAQAEKEAKEAHANATPTQDWQPEPQSEPGLQAAMPAPEVPAEGGVTPVTEVQSNTDAAPSTGKPVYKSSRRDCQRLLRLLGVPYIEAPSEAEASCAALVKSGKVHCTITEDMDALPFGSTLLTRHFTSRKYAKFEEFCLPVVLKGLDVTHEQFVDLCILMGCDYCAKIRGIGPKRALSLIRTHKTIEEVVKNIDTQKHPPPQNWVYKEARQLFLDPEVVDVETVKLEWTALDEEGLVQLLVHEKNAKEYRVRNRIRRLRLGLQCIEEKQARIDQFFPKKKHHLKRKRVGFTSRSRVKRPKIDLDFLAKFSH